MSITRYTGTGAQTDFLIGFPYLQQSHVQVRVGGVLQTTPAQYTFLNPTTIRFVSAPANGAGIEFRRNSNQAARLTDYQDGSTLTEGLLDADATQTFYVAQEAIADAAEALRPDAQNRYDAQNRRIINVATPVDPQDVVTRGWAIANLGGSAGPVPPGAITEVEITNDAARQAAIRAKLGVGTGSLPDGTVGAPAQVFTNEATTGVYRPGAGQWGISILGTLRALFRDTLTTLRLFRPGGTGIALDAEGTASNRIVSRNGAGSTSAAPLELDVGALTLLAGAINDAPSVNLPAGPSVNLDTMLATVGVYSSTNAITGATLADGRIRWVRFNAVAVLTHGASLQLPGSENITTAVGDWALFVGGGGGVTRVPLYVRADGRALVPPGGFPDYSRRRGFFTDFTNGSLVNVPDPGFRFTATGGAPAWVDLNTFPTRPGVVRLHETGGSGAFTGITSHEASAAGLRFDQVGDFEVQLQLEGFPAGFNTFVGWANSAVTAGILFQAFTSNNATNWLVRVGNGTFNSILTGVQPVNGTWYRLRLRRIDADTFAWSINGSAEQNITRAGQGANWPADTTAVRLYAGVLNSNSSVGITLDSLYYNILGGTRA